MEGRGYSYQNVYGAVPGSQHPPPPPCYDENMPLIYNQQQSNNNHRIEYIRVFHVDRHQYQYIISRILYLIMLILLFSLFLMYFSLFLTFDQPYRYMLFVRRWPPTVCQKQWNLDSGCISDVKRYQKWVIHGLWPEFSNNTWEQYCTKQHLNIDDLNPIKPELLKIWPNLLNGKSVDSLWQHEWDKHGTCTHLKPIEYFGQSLNLYSEYDLERALENAGIVPRNEKYSKQEFENALRLSQSDKSYVLVCDQHGHDYYIREIMLCVSFHRPDELTYCTMENKCPDYFYYTGFQ